MNRILSALMRWEAALTPGRRPRPEPRTPAPPLSTGCPALDAALGAGGLPRGRIVEVCGAESSGKTTLALRAVAEAQRRGGVAAYIDAEHALDAAWAERCGVAGEALLLNRPETGEEALEIALRLVETRAVDVVVVDSVAALVPGEEIEAELGECAPALQAELLDREIPRLAERLRATDSVVLFINQRRGRDGAPPGGDAVPRHAAIRLETRPEKRGWTRVRMVKDPWALETRETTVELTA